MQKTTPYYLPTTVKTAKLSQKNKSVKYEDNNINQNNTEDTYDHQQDLYFCDTLKVFLQKKRNSTTQKCTGESLQEIDQPQLIKINTKFKSLVNKNQ